MKVEIISFGHKYGVPEADVILDARCLENPFWVPELKEMSGLDAEVQEYILRFPDGKKYIKLLSDLIRLHISMAERHGAESLRIAVGCTGGRHRSVTVAQLLFQYLQEENYDVSVMHRDIERG